MINARRWIGRFKFIFVFCLFTYALYNMLIVITQWIEPTQRYKEPAGRAVKVFQNHVSISDQGTMRDRLKLFYWLGE